MIKIDKNKVEIEGKGTQILAELTGGVLSYAKSIVEKGKEEGLDITIEDAVANIITHIVEASAFALHIDKEDK